MCIWPIVNVAAAHAAKAACSHTVAYHMPLLGLPLVFFVFTYACCQIPMCAARFLCVLPDSTAMFSIDLLLQVEHTSR